MRVTASATLSMLLGGIAVAATVLFMMVQANGQAASAPTRGPYMITPAGDDRNTVWRVDQSTGRVSYCVRNITSTDPALIATRAPFCSAWSE